MAMTDPIAAIDAAFGQEARPELFIRGSCWCEECVEHNETMKAQDPADISLEAFGNPGWDPVCMASDAAYRYLLPGLARLVVHHTDAYLDQFVFHLCATDRISGLSPAQARALLGLLDWVIEQRPEALDDIMYGPDHAFQVRDMLEQQASVPMPEGSTGDAPK